MNAGRLLCVLIAGAAAGCTVTNVAENVYTNRQYVGQTARRPLSVACAPRRATIRRA